MKSNEQGNLHHHLRRHYECYGSEKGHYVVEILERHGFKLFEAYYYGLYAGKKEAIESSKKERIRLGLTDEIDEKTPLA